MWEKIKAWFKDSETIFFARLQMVAGAVWAVLTAADLSPLLEPKWLTVWLLASGILTELLRRRRADM
jgi:hypothetical protein